MQINEWEKRKFVTVFHKWIYLKKRNGLEGESSLIKEIYIEL